MKNKITAEELEKIFEDATGWSLLVDEGEIDVCDILNRNHDWFVCMATDIIGTAQNAIEEQGYDLLNLKVVDNGN